MKILVYTQIRRIGGGTINLLINLAAHLAGKHDISFAVSHARERDFFAQTARFDHACVSVQDILSSKPCRSFDVMLGHFPYGLDRFAYIEGIRKIAIILEIPAVITVPVTAENACLFDDIIFLHDTQISHIPGALDSSRYHRLDIIDDIDYRPVYARTDNVGCIKNEFAVLCDVIRRSPAVRRFNVYHQCGRAGRQILNSIGTIRGAFSTDTSGAPDGREPVRDPDPSVPAAQMSRTTKAMGFCLVCHRMTIKAFETNVRVLFTSFDCLLRTPRHSIGTSIAVHDALACGKYVVLSDIPEHRRSFAQFTGVFFVNDIGYSLDSIMKRYEASVFNEIRECYTSMYDRNKVLRDWEAVISV